MIPDGQVMKTVRRCTSKACLNEAIRDSALRLLSVFGLLCQNMIETTNRKYTTYCIVVREWPNHGHR